MRSETKSAFGGKIAIVHDYLTKVGGAERVLLVLHRIYPNAPIYTLLYDEKETRGMFKDCEIRPSYLQKYPSFIRKRSRLLLSKFPKAIEKLDLSEFDVIICSSNSFAHGVVTKPNQLHITYCFSPTRYLWDWSANYLQENKIGFGPLGMYVRSLLSKIRIWDLNASKRTNYWISISKTVAKRIEKYYRKDSKIIYPPVEIDKLLKNQKPAKNFFLIVSRLTQYKNIDLAIRAFNKLKFPLYIIGEGGDEKRLRSLAEKNIKFLGWLPDEKRNRFFSECKAFIFPGEDDFGLTPIEVMAAGRPVIALNAGGATETIVKGVSGEFFQDTTKPDDLIKTIKKFEADRQKYTPAESKNQAKKFSTEVFEKNFRDFVDQSYKEFKSK